MIFRELSVLLWSVGFSSEGLPTLALRIPDKLIVAEQFTELAVYALGNANNETSGNEVAPIEEPAD